MKTRLDADRLTRHPPAGVAHVPQEPGQQEGRMLPLVVAVTELALGFTLGWLVVEVVKRWVG